MRCPRFSIKVTDRIRASRRRRSTMCRYSRAFKVGDWLTRAAEGRVYYTEERPDATRPTAWCMVRLFRRDARNFVVQDGVFDQLSEKQKRLRRRDAPSEITLLTRLRQGARSRGQRSVSSSAVAELSRRRGRRHPSKFHHLPPSLSGARRAMDADGRGQTRRSRRRSIKLNENADCRLQT